MVEQPYNRRIRNLSRINPSVSSSAMGGSGFEGFSATLNKALNIEAKASQGEIKDQEAKAYIDEQVESLGNLVGVAGFTEEDLKMQIAYMSREQQQLGNIGAAENFATQNAIDEKRTQLRMNAIASELQSSGAVQRMSNPDPNFASSFDQEFQRSLLAVGGEGYENVVEHDTQGNPVTLNMDDLSIQELVLFSRYSFAQKTAFEKAAREQQDKRSMESSIIRAQIDIDKNLQRIKESARLQKQYEGMTDLEYLQSISGQDRFAPLRHPDTKRRIWEDKETGELYSERSKTYEVPLPLQGRYGGKWVNISSINTNTGEEYATFDEAFEAAIEDGTAFFFDTKEEAIEAAKERSERLSRSLRPDYVDMRENAIEELKIAYNDIYMSGVASPNKVFVDTLNSSLKTMAANSGMAEIATIENTINGLIDTMQRSDFSLWSDDAGPVPFAAPGTGGFDSLQTIRAEANEIFEKKYEALDDAQPDLEDQFALATWREYMSLIGQDPNYFLNENNKINFQNKWAAVGNRMGIVDPTKPLTAINKIWDREPAEEDSSEAKLLQDLVYNRLQTTQSRAALKYLQDQATRLLIEGKITDETHRTLSNELQEAERAISSDEDKLASNKEEQMANITRYSKSSTMDTFVRGKLPGIMGEDFEENYVVDDEFKMDFYDIQQELEHVVEFGGNVKIDAGSINSINSIINRYNQAKEKDPEKMTDPERILVSTIEEMSAKLGKDIIKSLTKISTGLSFDGPGSRNLRRRANQAAVFMENYMHVSLFLDLMSREASPLGDDKRVQATELAKILMDVDMGTGAIGPNPIQ